MAKVGEYYTGHGGTTDKCPITSTPIAGGWFLAPAGAHACACGFSAPEAQCKAAVLDLAKAKGKGRKMHYPDRDPNPSFSLNTKR